MESGFTLDAIRPLVTHARPTGRHLVVSFRCPTSQQTVQAQWSAPVSSGLGGQVARQVKRSGMYEVRRQVNTLVRGLLGYGFAGRMVQQAADAAMTTAMRPSGPTSTGLSAQEIETGTLEAFRSVASQFAWVQDRWVHISAAGQFQGAMEKQMAAGPLTDGYDRIVAARMLVEVAGVHGGISDEERLFLGDAIDPELGSLDALMARPTLTGAELDETSAGAPRESMLVVAWSLALCDQHFDAAEEALLNRFAAGLGIDEVAHQEVKRTAQTYLVDQALERMFEWGQHDQTAREQLYTLGERIGMARSDVERAEARFQRRRGL